MRSRIPPLAQLIMLAAGLWGLSHLKLVEESFPNLATTVEGHFAAGGRVPGEFAGPEGTTYWSSWDGDDAHHGSLVMGPVVAPAMIILHLRGYPGTEANRVFLEDIVTGETVPLGLKNVGEEWRRLRIPVPTEWRGRNVRLHAVDEARSWGGWLAISKPKLAPWWAAWWTGVWPILGATLFSGLAAALLLTAAGIAVARWTYFPGPGSLLLAGAATATLGYVIFWITFAHAATGRFAVGVVFALAAAICTWSRRAKANILWRDRDWVIPALLMVATVVLHTGLLLLFSVDRPMGELAQNRYRENLPADNEIPRFFADQLRTGQPLRPFFGDWLSSDRPPLQTGWTLLLGVAPRLLGVGFADSDHIVAFWFHLLWIPAVWWWLHGVGASHRMAAAIIAAIASAGFFLINTVYVWPKLGAGALMLGAFIAWFIILPEAAAPGRRRACAGGMAALAWLAHGGVAFSLLAAGLLMIVSFRPRLWRRWIAAPVVFVALIVPWMGYQKFYDPPGNRLLKWHLAGVIPPDARGTFETIVTAYRETPARDLWTNRVSNVRMLFVGSWRDFFSFNTSAAQSRRDQEFFHLFFALGWWNLGFPALATLATPWGRRQVAPEELRFLAKSIGWVAATLLIWSAMMFLGWSTAIHQGSYAVLLGLFPALALALWRLHPILFGAVVTAQLVTFPSLWMSPPPEMAHLSVRGDAIGAVVVGFLALLLIVVGCKGGGKSVPARAGA